MKSGWDVWLCIKYKRERGGLVYDLLCSWWCTAWGGSALAAGVMVELRLAPGVVMLGLADLPDIRLKSSVLPISVSVAVRVPLLSKDRRLLDRGDSAPSPRENEPRKSRSARRLRLLDPKWLPVLFCVCYMNLLSVFKIWGWWLDGGSGWWGWMEKREKTYQD